MDSSQRADAPYQWIVNSNALGVGFLARESNFSISFLSRHAVSRLDDSNLLGKSSSELMGKPATHLADAAPFSVDQLRNPDNYPASVRTIIQDRHIEFAISPVYDAENYLGVMFTFKDITEESERLARAQDFQDRMSAHVVEARLRGDEAESAAADLGTSLSAVRTSGDEISRLLGELTRLNSQTTLLSLNANIEAARSENSAAFGVIAGEMRDLAASMAVVVDEVGAVAESIMGTAGEAELSSAAVTSSVDSVLGAQSVMEEDIRSSV